MGGQGGIQIGLPHYVGFLLFYLIKSFSLLVLSIFSIVCFCHLLSIYNFEWNIGTKLRMQLSRHAQTFPPGYLSLSSDGLHDEIGPKAVGAS